MVAAEGAAIPPPVVVMGTGGSGTRLVAEMLMGAGVFLGTRRNRAADAQVIGKFLRRWVGPYLDATDWINALSHEPQADLPPAPDPALVDGFRAARDAHRDGIPDPGARWGWKNPRAVYLLPALRSIAPGAHVVQLVRDGRDIAYSTNQNQLEAYGERIVGDLAGEPQPVRSAALWSRVNLAALRCGERMDGEHLVVRYEALCEDPSEVARLLTGVGLDASEQAVERAAAMASASPSVGRWRERDADELQRIEEVAREGLARFGYLEEG